MRKRKLDWLQNMEPRSVHGRVKKISDLPFDLPADYFEFMSKYDGAVGLIGVNNNYLDLWTLENVINLNPYYPKEDFCKEIVIIGSDGSGALYGYDFIEKQFFKTDEYQMTRMESIPMGKTFFELIELLK